MAIKTHRSTDYDGKTLGHPGPLVEPLLTQDTSHPGKLRTIGGNTNPAKHEDSVPALAKFLPIGYFALGGRSLTRTSLQKRSAAVQKHSFAAATRRCTSRVARSYDLTLLRCIVSLRNRRLMAHYEAFALIADKGIKRNVIV